MKSAVSLICLALAISFTSFIKPAEATTMLFNDKGSFLAATGATAATSIPTTPFTFLPEGSGFTSGSLSFNLVPGQSTRFIIDDWSTRLSGNELAISGIESFDMGIDTGLIFSFGFDFVEPENDPLVNGPFVDSTFSLSLFNSGALVDSFSFSRPNDTATFVGVWGDTLFNQVEIRETVGDIGNEFFGQFYTGTSPVPEPSTMLLLASGLIGLGFMRRRRKAV